MRRILIVLALLVAGLWGERADAPPADGRGSDRITQAAGSGPVAFLRPGSSLPVPAWQEAPASAPWAHSRSTAVARGPDSGAATRGAAFAARASGHREHTSSLALLRAGYRSFHTATPPPFRFV